MDLFSTFDQSTASFKDLPLSVRMRPHDLDEIIGQQHIIGKGSLLRRAVEAGRVASLILFGPPGTGKTSLAWCIARLSGSEYIGLNAASSNIDDVRKAIRAAKKRKEVSGGKTILFIDEIHRFNKMQQDALMPDIEEGNPILIAATVHNPSFYIAAPLLSRSLVFELKPLTQDEIVTILYNTLQDAQRGLGTHKVKADKQALEFLAGICEGDARRSLNALEIGVLTTPIGADGVVHFTLEVAQESIQKKAILYDRDEDAHYDTASAFIKSMRGTDPDAAVYWLAKMLEAGEDPRFIARRICICAAEDVGNADPMALVLAQAALQVSEFIGMPEARIPLAQATLYVACAPKSNAAYMALEKASADIRQQRTQQVPDHLKDASYNNAKKMGRGVGYKYAHDYADNFVDQQYMSQKAAYYLPTNNGLEAVIQERLKKLRQQK